MVDYFHTEQNNEFPLQDVMQVARELYTDEFKGKPVFDKYVQLLLDNCVVIREVLNQVQTMRSIHTAYGEQLNVIGEIVGRPRGVVSSELFTYFGFSSLGDPLAEPPIPASQAVQGDTYGSISDVTVGSPWFSLKSELGTSRPPIDDEYRLLIKAKILQNNTLATPEEIISAYKFLFNTGFVDIQELGNANVLIRIGKILSVVERGLILNFGGVGSLLPKPLGVTFEYEEFSEGRVFATKDVITGEVYGEELGLEVSLGDINNPDVGGILSNKITNI